MKEFAQCLRRPSPCRWNSKRSTSRQTITPCEFRIPGKYANFFLIGNKLSQLTIFPWFGVRIGCTRPDSLDDWYDGTGLSMRASSTSSSNSARISASFSWPAVCASFSSCFMRAREDLEARESRKIAKDINNGMRIGIKIYMTYF